MNNETIQKAVETIMSRIEKEIEYNPFQWNNIIVWKVGYADTVHQILTETLTQLLTHHDKEKAGFDPNQ